MNNPLSRYNTVFVVKFILLVAILFVLQPTYASAGGTAGTNGAGTGASVGAATNGGGIFASSTSWVTATTGVPWLVPKGVSEVKVKAWGAGGGGADTASNAAGGGGGYAEVNMSVLPGDILFVDVGSGGEITTAGGTGGEFTRVDIKEPNAISELLLIAGGGGGSGDGSASGADAGAGGGSVGFGGIGGLAVVGSDGGDGGSAGTAASGGAGGANASGGGTSGSGDFLTSGIPSGTNTLGGYGGGGYYGGGAGGSSAAGSGGGGGGSSYVSNLGTTVALLSGDGRLAANDTDTDYVSATGNGGLGNQVGSDGAVKFWYTKAVLDPADFSPVTLGTTVGVGATISSLSLESTITSTGGTDAGGNTAALYRRGYVYIEGNSGTPQLGDPGVLFVEEAGIFRDDPFALTISGLTVDTEYRIRPYAENITGLSYGDPVTAATSDGQIIFGAVTATSTNPTSVRAQVTINNDAGADIVRRGFLIASSSDGTPTLSTPEVRGYSDVRYGVTSTFDPGSSVQDITHSPDGTIMAVGTAARDVRLYNATTNALIATLTDPVGYPSSVAYSPDGSVLVVGEGIFGNNSIYLYNTATNALITTLSGPTDIIREVTYSPDGSTLAAASNDGNVYLYNTATNALIVTLSEQPSSVLSLAFSADGSRLASLGFWGSLYMYETTSNTLVSTTTITSSTISSNASLAYSPDGSVLAVGMHDSVSLYNATGTLLSKLVDTTSSANDLIFSPDGTRMILGTGDNKVYVYDTANYNLTPRPIIDALGSIAALSFSSSSNKLVVAAGDAVRLRKYDLVEQPIAGDIFAYTLSGLSPNQEYLVRPYAENEVGVWYENPLTISVLNGEIAFGDTQAVGVKGPSGTIIASSTLLSDGGGYPTRHGFVVATGTIAAPTLGNEEVRVAQNFITSQNTLNNIAVGPNGLRLLVGSSGLIRVSTDAGDTWIDRRLEAETNTTSLTGAAIGPSSEMLVVGNGYIRTSTDGGVTWIDRFSGVSGASTNLQEAAIGPNGEMLIVGQYGTIITSTNGGATWINRSTAAQSGNNFMRGAAIGPSGEMIVLGTSGYIRTSTNGGVSWTDRSLAADSGARNLLDVSIGPSGEMIVLGMSGYVRYSSDGGATWDDLNEVSEASTLNLSDAAFVSSNELLVVGPNQYIQKSSGGVQQWESVLPAIFTTNNLTYTLTIPNLALDTTYTIRSFAENAAGIQYGSTTTATTFDGVIEFDPTVVAPINGSSPSLVATTTVVTDGGLDLFSRGFEYSADPTFATGVATTSELGGVFEISTSTATFTSIALSVSAQEVSPTALLFNNTGTTLYVMGNVGDDINAYTLSTPYDISTATFDSVALNVSSQEFTPTAMLFNKTGNILYVMGFSGDDINAYTLTTPYDISTATFDSIVLSVAAQETNPFAMLFNHTGTTLYVMGHSGRDINSYSIPVGVHELGSYTMTLPQITPATTYYVRPFSKNTFGINYGDAVTYIPTISVEIGEHVTGQVTNGFAAGNASLTTPLYGWSVNLPESLVGIAEVNEVVLNVTDIIDVRRNNFGTISLYRDANANGIVDDGVDVLVGTTEAEVSRNGRTGSITFSVNDQISSTSQYLIAAEDMSIFAGSGFTIGLQIDSLNLLAEDNVFVFDVSGLVSSVQHERAGGRFSLRRGGGGSTTVRSGGSVAATPARFTPVSDALMTLSANEFLPTQTGQLANGWLNPQTAFVVDGNFTTVNVADVQQSYGGFEWNIPTTNEVQGVSVRMVAASALGSTIGVQYTTDGGLTYSSLKTTPALTATSTIYTLGGAGDTWGVGLTPADVMSEDFHVLITANDAQSEIFLDTIVVRIHNQATGGGGGGGGRF